MLTTDPQMQPVLTCLSSTAESPSYGGSYSGRLMNAGDRAVVLDNTQIEGHPQAVSINLSRDWSAIPDGDPATWDGVNADAHARITYRAGVGVGTVICDWGCQFSLVCSGLRIEVEAFAPHYLTPYESGAATYGVTDFLPKFTALLGQGALFPSMGPTFTSGLRAYPAAAPIIIPPFAGLYLPRIYRLFEGGGANSVLYPVEPDELRNIRVGFGNHTPVWEALSVSRDGLQSGIIVPPTARTTGVTFEAAPGYTYAVIDHYRLRL